MSLYFSCSILFYELHYHNLLLLGDLRIKRLHQLRNNSTGKYNTLLVEREREREREREVEGGGE